MNRFSLIFLLSFFYGCGDETNHITQIDGGNDSVSVSETFWDGTYDLVFVAPNTCGAFSGVITISSGVLTGRISPDDPVTCDWYDDGTPGDCPVFDVGSPSDHGGIYFTNVTTTATNPSDTVFYDAQGTDGSGGFVIARGLIGEGILMPDGGTGTLVSTPVGGLATNVDPDCVTDYSMTLQPSN